MLSLKLKELRDAVNKSQDQVANAIEGLSRGMLAHYETGRSFPKPAMLRKLARYYQVTETDLLRDEESPTCQQEERTQPLNSPTISQFRERLASEATVEVTPGIPLSDEHRMFLIKQFDLLLTAYQQAH